MSLILTPHHRFAWGGPGRPLTAFSTIHRMVEIASRASANPHPGEAKLLTPNS